MRDTLQSRWLAIAAAGITGAGIGGASAPASAEESAAPVELQEIIVTAQRREESLQKAAIAIDAVSAEGVIDRGITTAQDLGKVVPGLAIEAGGGNGTSIHIRGVGTRSNNSYLDTAVAMSFDGVFIGRAAQLTAVPFYDVERIEVLKGPQGILYGRNATGGAINILPAKPTLDKLGGSGLLSLGSYAERQVQAALNVPLNGSSAMRFAGSLYKHAGYNKDGSSDADASSFRAQYLLKPSEQWSLRIGADYTKQGGVGIGATMVGAYASTANGYVFSPSNLAANEGVNTPAANAYRATQLGAPGFGFLTPIQDKAYNDYKYYGVNAELNMESGIGTWTFIPAWRKASGSAIHNQAAFNSAWTQDSNTQTSVELRLASPSGAKVDYIAGLYYFKERSEANNTFNQEFVLPLQFYTHNAQSSAAFGQLTFHATDALRIVTGARYTRDRKDMNGTIDNLITFCGGTPPNNVAPPASFARGCAVPGNLPRYPTLDTPLQGYQFLVTNGWISGATPYTGQTQVFPLLNGRGGVLHNYLAVVDGGSNSRVTWKASLQYDVAPDSLLYATYETGYRAGGYQLAEGTPTYKPEFLDAASVGSKNRFLNGRLQVNAEAFLWKYKDQQINYFTLASNGTLISSTQNVGRSTNKGVDVDVLFAASHSTQLSARVSWLDAVYDDLHFVTAAPRDNFSCPFTLTGAISGGNPVKDFNCSGKPAVFSPKVTINAGIDQTIPIGRFDLVASLYSNWRDDQWAAIEYIQHEYIKSYTSTDASLELRPQGGGKWSVTAFGRNLEDKHRVITAQAAPTGQGMTTYGPGATYGVRLQASF